VASQRGCAINAQRRNVKGSGGQAVERVQLSAGSCVLAIIGTGMPGHQKTAGFEEIQIPGMPFTSAKQER
jgi:hypothetical protein